MGANLKTNMKNCNHKSDGKDYGLNAYKCQKCHRYYLDFPLAFTKREYARFERGNDLPIDKSKRLVYD